MINSLADPFEITSSTGLTEEQLFFAPLLTDYMQSMYDDAPKGTFQQCMERAYISWRLAHTYREIEGNAALYAKFANISAYWYEASRKLRFGYSCHPNHQPVV